MARSTYQPRLWSHLSLATLATVASGCQTGSTAYAPSYPAYDYSAAAPAAGPVPQQPMMQQQQSYSPVPYQALEAATLEIKERLERVEKAMLRLDRRMQLVERNELNRMGGPQQSSSNTGSGYTATSEVAAMSDEQAAMRALNIGPGDSGDGYRPVASRNEGITSALQAAPSLHASDVYTPGATMQVASRNGLPSLADPAPTQSRSLQQGNAQVAIWTVKYEQSKVWPDRAQLPASRDVVEALRDGGSSKLTIYARGKNANAVEFRERVKALSRYLSKVSSLDSVPIAAMAAPHLDDETIEILATH
ncbi:MAG: hypothetical protein EON60_00950 [Alphaproteobacteria bacterium]|nr:MAG: hypothetical protein EON60_00950 [Alphaproteobacteria bacterium]